ncbi:hypothetical protein DPMN_106279 [Dreissena polymorpha]|uniref:Paraneoplastic antigen Ma-like C-terminal domain-containing protein n=1 Tax=Dreissena polymorpha TaxID=45954 RepID=A0A9D4K4P6_DREPO|nr:hypothetical protein DPMN_106279 [Dreissena polymorpha]
MEEQQGAVGGRPTEEEMLEILSNKYEFHPKGTPYAAKQVGAKPNILPFVSTPIQPPSSPPGNQPVLLSSGHIPKIPLFPGEDSVPRNEITFYEWRHEVRCLMQDSTYTSSQVLQAIRNSLRGTARKLVVSLGDSVSVDLIFQKLDVNFAEPARKGITMKEFFNASQKLEETVTLFGCRLEAILEQAFEGGHLPRSAKNELMCERLWSGLHSEA